MLKGKLAVSLVISAALLGWQIAGVVTTTSGATNGIPADSNWASSAGTDCWFVCPLGDGDRLDELGATVSVVAKSITGAPLAGIPASDIWLAGCENGLVICSGGGIHADSATNANGETTISGAMTGGGCDQSGVAVAVQGVLILDPDSNYGFFVSSHNLEIPGHLRQWWGHRRCRGAR